MTRYSNKWSAYADINLHRRNTLVVRIFILLPRRFPLLSTSITALSDNTGRWRCNLFSQL